MSHRALILDRDGVINEDKGYVYKVEDFVFIDGIFDLVLSANKKKLLVVVVTNQSGIGRGFFSEEDFIFLTNWMETQFLCYGAHIDATYFCPDHPVYGLGKYKRDTNMRKPGPGMLLQAEKELSLNLEKSIIIGDSKRDVAAGLAAGVGTRLYYGQGECDGATACITSLESACKWIV